MYIAASAYFVTCVLIELCLIYMNTFTCKFSNKQFLFFFFSSPRYQNKIRAITFLVSQSYVRIPPIIRPHEPITTHTRKSVLFHMSDHLVWWWRWRTDDNQTHTLFDTKKYINWLIMSFFPSLIIIARTFCGVSACVSMMHRISSFWFFIVNVVPLSVVVALSLSLDDRSMLLANNAS